VVNNLNNAVDPITKTSLELEIQVYTTALAQAQKTLALLQYSYENGSSLLSEWDDKLKSAENDTNERITRFQQKNYYTISEIRQNWRNNLGSVQNQLETSLESLLNCTVNSDTINGLNGNGTGGISIQLSIHFDLAPGESVTDKISIVQTVFGNVLVAQAVVSKSTVQVTATSSSKRATGDLSVSGSVGPTTPTSSSSSSPSPSSFSWTPVIIGCVAGVVVLVALVVIVVVVLKKKGDERV